MKYIITVNKKRYEVDIENSMEEESIKKEPSQTSLKSEFLKAPMPGTIIAIKVNIGDSVERGDTLFIIEAMKMENEIASPCDGVIKEIKVESGASVNTNDILALIE